MDLADIAPDDPDIRAYILDIGMMAYMFARLERILIHYLDLSNAMALNLHPPVPMHETVEPNLKKKPLGPLLKVFARRCSNAGVVQSQERLNDDRISIIHRMRSFARWDEGIVSTNREGMHAESVRFREILPRVLDVGQDVRLAERELLKTYHDTLVSRFGPDHEGSRKIGGILAHVDDVIARLE